MVFRVEIHTPDGRADPLANLNFSAIRQLERQRGFPTGANYRGRQKCSQPQ